MSNLAGHKVMGEDDANRKIGGGPNKQDHEDGVDDDSKRERERESCSLQQNLPILYPACRPFWQTR